MAPKQAQAQKQDKVMQSLWAEGADAMQTNRHADMLTGAPYHSDKKLVQGHS